MSLKSIELQVAIPRTVEAGKLSEQLQQRGQQTFQQAASEMEEKLIKDRNSVNKMEQKEKMSLKDGHSKEQRDTNDHQHSSNKQKSKRKKLHPYKGKTIDYNG
ncbi:hypothetical protein [Bacillus sp. FJAT-50079]|uniref:hypothetical protein n=1 Tax=Bacillus sp. FJAT-50079 TaxID=2833577 RepID=UPI001BC8F4BD|nr:hypothetical protein [Bacillus sp. FJAT-50079]MBS4207598.1 hypothetical protein [Bacillus sp. FJAT-50079]